jgi:phosphatidylserine decarboxylase
MATIEPPPPIDTPITSIQPGGGLCVCIEQVWGRLRRAWLRRFFPGYVRKMTALRQGECPGCSHDVIDPRDLKLVRNVCGYWFRPEDDRFAWRGRLGVARAGLVEIICFSVLFLPLIALFIALGAVLSPWWLLPLAVLVPLWVFILAFFRDPERAIPADIDVLVSPADGVITHLEEVHDPDFPGGRAFRVSIFLSVFNVHVNRVPRSGTVTQIRYYPGAFLDARDRECAVRNEQLWIDFTDEHLACPIRVKQVAGAIARRIVCVLKPGEAVRAGERFGMIKFGSRTDVLVPASLVAEVLVRVGEAVAGGSRVLLRMRKESSLPDDPGRLRR